LTIHAQLGRKWIERPLGGITFHLPNTFLLEQLRIVAEHANASDELESRVLAHRLPFLLDLALGRVAITSDLIHRLGGHGRHHHHLHEGECAGRRLKRYRRRWQIERLFGDWLKAEVKIRKERVERLELELLAPRFVEL
jgi:hypothetical protein